MKSMKGSSDSKVICESVMDEVDHRENRNQKNKKVYGSHLRKAPNRAGSNPMTASLPKTASMKTYSTARFNPSRRRSAAVSGHISIIPKEARAKKKGGGFESEEPTSPKVSCVGKIKLKKKQAGKRNEGSNNNSSCRSDKDKCSGRFSLPAKETRGELVKMSRLRRLFSGKKRSGKPVLIVEQGEAVKKGEGNSYPSLGQMKPFTSNRYRESAAVAKMCIGSENLVSKKNKIDASRKRNEKASDTKILPMVARLGFQDNMN